MEDVEIPQGHRGRTLQRQPSRLQMRAPSSIQISPTAAAASISEWNIAIPLLSPLDISSVPDRLLDHSSFDADPSVKSRAEQAQKRETKKEDEAAAVARWRAWQNPAAPFRYDPVPSNVPPFIVPRCT